MSSPNRRIDISHRTKRYQSDIVTENDLKNKDGEDNESSTPIIPINVTLESAITFYEEHAEGDYELLYKRTANWLKMLFSNSLAINKTTGNIPDAMKLFLAIRSSKEEAKLEGDKDED